MKVKRFTLVNGKGISELPGSDSVTWLVIELNKNGTVANRRRIESELLKLELYKVIKIESDGRCRKVLLTEYLPLFIDSNIQRLQEDIKELQSIKTDYDFYRPGRTVFKKKFKMVPRHD